MKKILIVEDNELNRKLFRDLLTAAGYAVIETQDGATAMEMASREAPDLILMDIQLHGVSGLEVIRWLKEDPALRRIPVIAVTAYAMKGDEERIRDAGCDAYLSKPINVRGFLEAVAEHLELGACA